MDVAPVRKRSRREQIVSAARTLFAASGVDGTSLAELADAVGVSKAALFQYFSTKEEIYAAVVDEVLAAVTGDRFAALRTEGDFDERLVRFADAAVLTFYAHPDARRLVARALLESPPRGPSSRIHAAFAALIFEFRALVMCGIAEGVLAPETHVGQACLSALAIHFVDWAPGVRTATSRATAIREQTRQILGVRSGGV